MRRAKAYLLGILSIASVACSSPNPDDRTIIDAPAFDPMTFVAVTGYALHRCGTLDCHGQIGRNLRLYGHNGLRLDPMETPGGGPTSQDEIELDYRSMVGLEPEATSAVVRGEDNPENLLLLAKPLMIEDHQGGQLMQHGDSQEICIVSWLRGAVDTGACQDALNTP